MVRFANKHLFRNLSAICWRANYQHWVARLYRRTVLQVWMESPYLKAGAEFE